jgi:carboxyl-terminal processing protease
MYTLGMRHNDGEAYTAADKLAEAASVIDDYYIGDYDSEKMTDAAIEAMIKNLGDRWSYYMTADELASYTKTTNNEYAGIGIVIQKDEEGRISVVTVYSKSPAGNAGILAGSVIKAVGEKNIEGWTLDDALIEIKKAIDAGEVTLTLEQPDGTIKSFTLIPGTVETDPVAYELLDDGIGLITIKNFEAKCALQSQEAVAALTAKGAKGIVFDVRNNPGGQLDELLDILDYILPEGKIFIRKNIDGGVEEDMSDAACVKLPMAVMINADSYSAAEFFAAALSEYDWAVTVGEKTTGKGYAQITLQLKDGSAIHISSMEYFTPSGQSLANIGLTPDIAVDIEYEDRVSLYGGSLAHSEDAQLIAAVDAVKEKIKDAA